MTDEIDAAAIRRQALEEAADWVERRQDDYIAEHGAIDPETGAVEFPGTGDEYVYELDEIMEGILGLVDLAPDDDDEENEWDLSAGEPFGARLRRFVVAEINKAARDGFDETEVLRIIHIVADLCGTLAAGFVLECDDPAPEMQLRHVMDEINFVARGAARRTPIIDIFAARGARGQFAP